MRTTLSALFLMLVGSAALAQQATVGPLQGYVDSQISAVQSTIPQPANSPPVTDATTGAVGSQTGRFMLEDSVRPARYRSASGTIAGGSGLATLTWSTPFSVTPNPIGDPAILNSNSLVYYQCNWVTVTTTGATVKCAAPLVTISLGLLNLLPAAPNGLVVSGTAVMPL